MKYLKLTVNMSVKHCQFFLRTLCDTFNSIGAIPVDLLRLFTLQFDLCFTGYF